MSKHDPNNDIEIEVEPKHETRKAYLVEHKGEEVWIPKTGVTNQMREEGKMRFTIKREVADQKGLPFDDDED